MRTRPSIRFGRLCAGSIALMFLGACSTPQGDMNLTAQQIVPEEVLKRSPVQSGVRHVFFLLHADADEVASTLTELIQASRRSADTRNIRLGYCALMTPEFWAQQKRNPSCGVLETQILADSHTNSVLVIPSIDEPDDVDRMAELIHRLDVSLDGPPSIH
jgi:hypothetical protein